MIIDSTNIETWIKRYVLDQLDESQAEEFENYYLARPDVIEKIAAAQKIKLGLEVLESDSEANSTCIDNVVTARSREHSLLARILGWMTVPVPSYAMLAALAILGPLALNNTAFNQVASDSDIQLVRLDAPSVRSFETTKGVNLSVVGKQTAVVVRVKGVDYPKYKLSINATGSESSLWSSDFFAFASGARDHLILIPPHAAIDSANVQLFGVNEQGQEIEVSFCNYTEACF